MKRGWVAAAVLVCALLLGVWVFLTARNSSLPPDEAASGHAPLTLDEQTPVVPEANTPKKSEASEEDAAESYADSNEQSIESAATDRYQFETWQDGLDVIAHMMSMRFDELKAKGIPPGMDIPEEDQDRWFRSRAESEIKMEVFSTDKHPMLKEAMRPFLNEIPPKEWSPDSLFVRAGRLPASVLDYNVTLPNGEIYTLQENTKLVIVYRQNNLTEAGIQKLAEMQAKETDLLRRLASIPSESEADSLNAELETVQIWLKHLQEPTGTAQRGYTWGDPKDPDFKTITIDLGVIEEDLSAAKEE